MDCPSEFPANVAGVIQLLDRERHLAVKPEAGTHGAGFCKVSAVDGANLLNNQPIGRDELVRFLSSCTRHLVTEYIFAHKDLRRIYPHSPNALRVIVIHDSSEGPQIVGAFLRFGTSRTGVIDNASAGGVFCGVDLEGGRFIDPRRYEEGKCISAPTHPDTGVAIEGKVPFWTEIRQTLSEMAMHMPQLVYMGFDVLITDTGLKVIEINSHPALTRMQQYYPLLKDPRSRRFFTSLARAGSATRYL
jgi:hypothetical protein